MLFELGVVVDLEVIGRVDHPPEFVVVDVVLAEVRHHRRLRPRGRGEGGKKNGHEQHARAHSSRPRKRGSWERFGILLSTRRTLQTACWGIPLLTRAFVLFRNPRRPLGATTYTGGGRVGNFLWPLRVYTRCCPRSRRKRWRRSTACTGRRCGSRTILPTPKTSCRTRI